MEAHFNQEAFLSNQRNKSQESFLSNQRNKSSSRCFEADAHVVHNSTGDADMMIVECALQFAIGEKEVSKMKKDISSY